MKNKFLLGIGCVFLASSVGAVVPGTTFIDAGNLPITRTMHAWDETQIDCQTFDCEQYIHFPLDPSIAPLVIENPNESPLHSPGIGLRGGWVRDTYREPGLVPWLATDSATPNEKVYLHGGILQINHVDLSLPGNGGLDLSVTRSYVGDDYFKWFSSFGTDWFMHFGRIKVMAGYRDQICDQDFIPQSANPFDSDADPYMIASTYGNPVLEHRDGRREILVNNGLDNDGSMITKSNWKAVCIDPNNAEAGLYLYSPDGMRYTMDVLSKGRMAKKYGIPIDSEILSTSVVYLFFDPSEIRDKNGNTLTFNYNVSNLEDESEYHYLDTVLASDGRQLTYSYVTWGIGFPVLSSVTDGERTVNYNFTDAGYGVGDFGYEDSPTPMLDSVDLPDGTGWSYSYGSDSAQRSFLKITDMDYPSGLHVSYQYNSTLFIALKAGYDPATYAEGASYTTVSQKTLSGSGIPTSIWAYNYTPGWQGTPNAWDVATITGPDNIRVVEQYSMSASASFGTSVNGIGLPVSDAVYDLGGSPLSLTQYGWAPSGGQNPTISDEYFIQFAWEAAYLTELRYEGVVTQPSLHLKKEYVYGTGATGETTLVFTQYTNHDLYGNPGRITESAVNGNALITDITYINDTAKWQIGLPDVVSLQDSVPRGSIDYDYDANYNVESINRFGVTTNFTYTPEGDLASVRDARNNGRNFSNYYRGSPQTITHSDGIGTISQVINDTGTVQSMTSEVGDTTSYQYDLMNRVKQISRTGRSPVNINYTFQPNSKNLTYGSYSQVTNYDELFRPLNSASSDSATGVNSTSQWVYDDAGNLESQNHDGVETSYGYDGIKRLRVANTPNGPVTYDYSKGNMTYVDAKGFAKTQYYYLRGGLANNLGLYMQEFDEGQSGVIYYRNFLGQVFDTRGGAARADHSGIDGFARQYTFDSKYFLDSVYEPETGTIDYTTDLVGNILSETTSGPTGTSKTFTYDARNRLETTTHADASLSSVFTYRPNGQVESETNGFSSRVYTYNSANDLETETITIGDNTYTITYTYTSEGQLNTITYPSGQVVTYNPDTQGRPTQVFPFIDSVTYSPDGLPDQVMYANGQMGGFSFNAKKQLENISIGGYSSEFGESLDTVGMAFTYDNNNNIDAITRTGVNSNDLDFDYDQQDRLIQNDNTLNVDTFVYDNIQNIDYKTLGGKNYNYDYGGGIALDQITEPTTLLDRQFSHDVRGNVSADRTSLGGIVTDDRIYQFDDANNLRSVRFVKAGADDVYTYQYDTRGNRVRKVNSVTNEESEYVYNSAGLLIGEFNPDGSLVRENYFLGRQMIASVQDLPINQTPQINTATTIEVEANDLVVIDDSLLTDSDGVITRYRWTPTNADAQALTITSNGEGGGEFTVANTAPFGTEYIFEVKANDNRGAVTTGTITYKVIDPNNPGNTPPVADAGLDQTVDPGDTVVLNGTGSSDAEGPITYLWSQVGGTGVTLSGNTGATPTFTAPATGPLTFQLQVTDADGAIATDTVTIQITVDSTPPVTSFSSAFSRVKGVKYFDITLSTDEPVTTYFRLMGEGTVISGGSSSTDWQAYVGPVTVQLEKGKSSASFEYYSVDTAGNQEATQLEVLQ